MLALPTAALAEWLLLIEVYTLGGYLYFWRTGITPLTPLLTVPISHPTVANTSNPDPIIWNLCAYIIMKISELQLGKIIVYSFSLKGWFHNKMHFIVALCVLKACKSVSVLIREISLEQTGEQRTHKQYYHLYSNYCKRLHRGKVVFSAANQWLKHIHHRTCRVFFPSYSTAPGHFYTWVYLVDWVVPKHNI